MTPENFYEKYKEGDFLVFEDRWMVIFAKFTDPADFARYEYQRDHAIVYHALMNLQTPSHVSLATRTGIGYIESRQPSDIRLATNTEIKRFYKMLHEHHCEWDSSNNQLIVHEVLSRIYT
jgi:hypothetical protein